MSDRNGGLNWIATADWILAVIALLAGIYLVATSWPSPNSWAWVFLASGIIGIPLAYFNPMAKVRKWIFRLMVKR